MIFTVSNKKINYLYNASGVKVEKKVTNGTNIKTTHYTSTRLSTSLDGFQYVNEKLQFFPTSEGYVKVNLEKKKLDFKYVYNYTDHLGNIRLSYTKGRRGPEIIEENNYYPFGLEHNQYNQYPSGNESSYQYKYQSQERQDELNLNWDSFKWRNYDYAIGRFMSVDPLAEEYVHNGVYNFSENRVVEGVELEGLEFVPSSKLFEGQIASARDIGNFAAGAVAGSNALDWGAARLGFDGLQKWQDKSIFSVEGVPTQSAQRAGHNLTYPQYIQKEYKMMQENPMYKVVPKW